MDRLDEVKIPVNIRTVGNPKGNDVLYLEDYVHTFIRKLLDKEENAQEEGCEVFLFGYEFSEGEQHFLIIPGAIECREFQEKRNDAQYFPSYYNVGKARIIYGRDNNLLIDIILQNGKCVNLDNFYIYYDKNEEMQNYLIEWNHNQHNEVVRNDREESVRLGRVVQAYNREEVRVNYMWNVMNAMSLLFMICILAYGIISINNYNKMKDMQETLTYVVTVMSEKTEDLKLAELLGTEFAQASRMESSNAEPPQSEASQNEISQNEISQNEIPHTEQRTQAESDNSQTSESGQTQEINSEEIKEVQSEESSTEARQEAEAQEQTEPADAETGAALAENEAKPVSEEVYRLYVIQKGDTLRKISFDVYGSYDNVSQICELNQIEDPNSILYGQKLLLP